MSPRAHASSGAPGSPPGVPSGAPSAAPSEPGQHRRRPPVLAVTSTTTGGDGIAYVGRLLARALDDITGAAAPVVSLEPRHPEGASRWERSRFVARLARAQCGRADWAFFTHVGLARAAAAVPRPWRVPYAVMLNGVEAWDAAMSPGRQRAARGATLRVAISHYTAARARAAHPDIGPIRECPLGLLPGGGELAEGAGAEDPRIVAAIAPLAAVIVGRVASAERYKGHDELLAAWPTVVATVPSAQLVIVGRGDDLPRLRAKAAALGLGETVLFTGYVSDATRDAVLRRATVFAMPSVGEGFGLAYLDAMRAGLPCVACVDSAGAELVRGGRTGILVQRRGAAELGAAVASMLANPGLARQMGEEGRQRYEAEYTYDRFRERLRDVLSNAPPAIAGPRDR